MRRFRGPHLRRSSAGPPTLPSELGVFFSGAGSALLLPTLSTPFGRPTSVPGAGISFPGLRSLEPPKPQLKRGAEGHGWGEWQPPGLWPWLPVPASAVGTPSLGRDVASVLKQDRERLRAMQKQQPRFSEDQRRELGAVHSWVRKGQLPRALDVMVRGVWARREKGRLRLGPIPSLSLGG